MKEQTLDDVFSEIDTLFKSVKKSDLKVSIDLGSIDLFKDIKDYGDVCWALGIDVISVDKFDFLPKEQRLKALFAHKIQNICKLFNGNWIIDWNNNQQKKWFPYFIKSSSGGWSFDGSGYGDGFSSYAVVGYYLDQKTSDHCGKLFLQEYSDYINN